MEDYHNSGFVIKGKCNPIRKPYFLRYTNYGWNMHLKDLEARGNDLFNWYYATCLSSKRSKPTELISLNALQKYENIWYKWEGEGVFFVPEKPSCDLRLVTFFPAHGTLLSVFHRLASRLILNLLKRSTDYCKIKVSNLPCRNTCILQ